MMENKGNLTSKAGVKGFKEEISNRLFNKYGLFPDNFILNSLKEELEAIEIGEREEEIIILYDFINWLKKERIPYWLRGTAGSSLVFYLLGITRGNPLPAHSYCPKCKSLDWLDNYHNGFDVGESLQCQKDEHILVTDGHNIPWQSLWGYMDNEIVFTIDLPIESYDRIRKFWKDYQFDILKQEDLLEIREEFKGFRFLNIDCIFTIEEVNSRFYENELDIDNAIKSFDLGELPSPQKFSDLLYGSGLNNSTGAWTEKTRYMVENLGMKLSDMIAFRDDVYFYLLEHNSYQDEAWLGAESFRRPKSFFEITEEMEYAADKWKLAICQDVKYLFPKAHDLEYIIFKMKNHN